MKEEGHKLDAVESKLYSRTLGKDMQYKKHELGSRVWETPKKWEEENEEVENNKTEYNPQLMPLNSSNEINNMQNNMQSNKILRPMQTSAVNLHKN